MTDAYMLCSAHDLLCITAICSQLQLNKGTTVLSRREFALGMTVQTSKPAGGLAAAALYCGRQGGKGRKSTWLGPCNGSVCTRKQP